MSLVLVATLVAVYFLTRRTLLVQFSELEQQETLEHLDRLKTGLATELDLMGVTARDDAMWDEAYEFVQHPRPGWAESNFGEGTLSFLRLNVFVYLDAAGHPVYAREFDSESKKQRPASEDLVSYLVKLTRAMPLDKDHGARGLVPLPDGPMLVAMWPVIHSTGAGATKGVLVIGRRFDRGELQRLGRSSDFRLDFLSADKLLASNPQREWLRQLSPSEPVLVKPLGGSQVAGYSLLSDIYGKPSVILRLVTPRAIYQQGRTTLYYLILVMLASGLVFLVVSGALLDRMILSPLIRLHDAVVCIGAGGDAGRRVPQEGSDEIAQLGASTNRMLAALEQSQQALRRQACAFEACTDGIAIFDEDGTLAHANHAHAALFGFKDKKDLLGKSWRDLYAPEDAERVQAQILSGISKDRTWEGEILARRQDGKLFPHFVSVAHVSGGGWVGVCRDMTAQRAMEEQLRKKQRMEAVGTLAGGIAHDFNNLLTVILGYGQTLMAKVEDQPRLLANADHIVKAATRAAALTRQLLAFSRKQVLQPRVLDLNAVLQDLEKILRPLVNDGIVMETCLASNLGAVRADQSQIEQVIVNLIVNARDAMANGGWLTVSTENVDWPGGVSVPKGRYVVLSVKDTGTGMDPEVLAHIFEPFYTTKEVGKGTGLGLSTVYGIVEQSAGYVTVESEPGKGSQFKVFLPRVDAVADGLPQEAPSSMRQNGHETVLVVEDDPGVLDLAQEVLTNYGYKVLCASHSNGLEEILREHGKNIDLLLTDVRLPGITGREIAMRVQEAHPHVRVLYMSGYAALNFPAQGTEAGISFVQKPFTTAQLTEKVREVLDQRKAFAHHAG